MLQLKYHIFYTYQSNYSAFSEIKQNWSFIKKLRQYFAISLHIILYEIPQIIKGDLSIGNEWSKLKKYEKLGIT